ncbi:hypothetical protein L2E82_50082 [Cichorium intybus]|nr:hypothetical protein L2E82_50082 [Cichorium intybus]
MFLEKKNMDDIKKENLTPNYLTNEILAKAGIVTESSQEKKNVGPEPITLPQQNISPQQAPWMHYQIPPIQQPQHVFMSGHHQVQQPLPIEEKSCIWRCDREDSGKEVMGEYRYSIEHILMVDITPDRSVRRALNEINAAQRLQLASVYKGEADKILQVKILSLSKSAPVRLFSSINGQFLLEIRRESG